MNRRAIVALGASLLLSACAAGPEYKTIISGTVGTTTVTLQAVNGRLIVGDNDLRLRFTDSNQQPVDVPMPTFTLKQAQAGATPSFSITAEMKAAGTGQYESLVSLGSQGNWQGTVTFDEKGKKQEWGFASMVL
jgi:nitrogen fixation protein FixH